MRWIFEPFLPRVGNWEKTRRLAEPSAHEDDLRALAYRLLDAAGLQRGRLIALALRGDDLISAGQVTTQISLDQAREARLVAEAAIDRVRDKFGPGVIGPAAVFRNASCPHPDLLLWRYRPCSLTRPASWPIPKGCRTGPTSRPSTTPSPHAASRWEQSGPTTPASTAA
jgi:hypothetical protein